MKIQSMTGFGKGEAQNSADELLQKRFEKFRAMGNDTIVVVENGAVEG